MVVAIAVMLSPIAVAWVVPALAVGATSIATYYLRTGLGSADVLAHQQVPP